MVSQSALITSLHSSSVKHMKVQTAPLIDFRRDFSQLDPLVWVTPADVMNIIAAPSIQAVYMAIERGDLPEPLVRRNRQIRFSVGQLREYLKGREQAYRERLAIEAAGKGSTPAPGAHGGGKRGRPRISVAPSAEHK